MSTALLRRSDLSIEITPDALAMKNEALAGAALIGRVSNAQEQDTAVAAAARIKSVLDTVEKARTVAKAPLLEAGRKLDQVVKDFRVDLENEWGRIMHDLVGPFQMEEKRRLDRERQRQEEELKRIESEKQAALAKAETPEAKQAVEEQAAMRAAVVDKPMEAPRAQGQIVRDDWEIEVINPYELAKYHPNCVKVEPKLAEIKALLNEGITVKGITAKKVVKTSVRTNNRNAVINV